MIQSECYEALSHALGEKRLKDLLERLGDYGIFSRGAVLGLTEEQTACVHAYTLTDTIDGQSLFRTINAALRKGDGALEPKIFDVLLQGLEKMPKFEGVAVRRTELPAEVISMNSGQLFADPAFLSASRNLDPHSRVYFGRDVLFLRSITGRDISSLAAFASEQEILFLPGTKFRISSVSEAGTGFTIIGDEET